MKTTDHTLRGILYFGFFGLLLAVFSMSNDVDLDVFHELALIREALVLGRLPAADSFAYTPTIYPVVHHEWGTGAVLYLAAITSGLGGAGLVLLKGALCAFIAVGCYVCARGRGATEPVLAFLGPIAIGLIALGFSTIRAQVFTLAFLVCLLFFLTADSRGRRSWLVCWFPLYVVWLNMHGGFLVGAGLFGVYTLEQFVRELVATRSWCTALRQVRHLLLGLLAMFLLVGVTPYGVDYARYLWHAIRLPRPNVPEWGPLWEQGSWSLMLLFFLSLALVVYAIACSGVRALCGVSLVLVTAGLSLPHLRHIILYAVVWACLVPAWISGTPLGAAMEGVWRKRTPTFLAFWILCGLSGLGYATYSRFWELRVPTQPLASGELKESFPAGAVQYLADSQFQGNLMVTYQTGAFVSWKLHPAVRVSIDSRYEVAYPPELAVEILSFYQAKEGWQKTLCRYPTDAVLVPAPCPLGQLLRAATDYAGGKGWRQLYRDDAYSLYFREGLARKYPVVDRAGDGIVGVFP